MSGDDGVLTGSNAVAFYAVQKFTARARGLVATGNRQPAPQLATHRAVNAPHALNRQEGPNRGGGCRHRYPSRQAVRYLLPVGVTQIAVPIAGRSSSRECPLVPITARGTQWGGFYAVQKFGQAFYRRE